ncbi:unnamed protein product, partial [Prorocentrum cordatum]
LKGRVAQAARGPGGGMPFRSPDCRGALRALQGGGDGCRETRRRRRCPARAAAPRWLLRCSFGALAIAAYVVAASQASWVALPRPAAPAARWARGSSVRLAARGGDEEGEETAPAPAPAPPAPPLTEVSSEADGLGVG